jgi:hypothetical protein
VAFANRHAILYFGLLGAAHATTLVLALRTAQGLAKRSAFVVCSSVLSAAVFVVGWVVITFVLHPEAALYLWISMSLTAAVGAAMYGALIRRFWIAGLSIAAIIAIAATCGVATCSVLVADQFNGWNGRWQMTVTWWFAFSAALALAIYHGSRLSLRTTNSQSRETA